MPYVVTADGVRAYYDFAGQGPALVMVHGASQDSLSWKYVVDRFARHYSVYVLDLPGHGKSALPAGGPHTATPDNARYVLQCLDALGLADAVLMGHSMAAASSPRRPSSRPAGCAAWCWSTAPRSTWSSPRATTRISSAWRASIPAIGSR